MWSARAYSNPKLFRAHIREELCRFPQFRGYQIQSMCPDANSPHDEPPQSGTTPGERRPRLPELRPAAASVGCLSVGRACPRLLVLSHAAKKRSSAPTPPDGTSEALRSRPGASQAPGHEGRRPLRDPHLGGGPGGGHAPLRPRQQPHGVEPAAQARLGVPRGRPAT